jgi:disulfide bond formation protein DsbB
MSQTSSPSVISMIRSNLNYLAWVQALIAMLGSLFFSEVMKLPPCILCWYQRILMYPLVLILAVGMLRDDKNVKWYALPLSILGFCIALYHNLLYYGILPEAMSPCMAGISCTSKTIQWFGFVTIPFLSLVAFLVITLALLFFRKESRPSVATPED